VPTSPRAARYFRTQTLLTSSVPGGHRRAEASGTTVKSPSPKMARATAAATIFFMIGLSLGRYVSTVPLEGLHISLRSSISATFVPTAGACPRRGTEKGRMVVESRT